jgi:elongation factor G
VRRAKDEPGGAQDRVVYRGEGRFVKQSGGPGQYGHCILEVEPQPNGTGFNFETRVENGAVPALFFKPIEAGVREAMAQGMLAGYPIVDVRVTLVDGSYHEKDSNAYAFQTAGAMAFRDACSRAEMALLEPVGQVEVTTPSAFVGSVIGDLNRRRGRIERQQTAPGETVIVGGVVPIAEMFGYASDLRSMTQGRASFSLQPSGYEEAPRSIVTQIAAQRA